MKDWSENGVHLYPLTRKLIELLNLKKFEEAKEVVEAMKKELNGILDYCERNK